MSSTDYHTSSSLSIFNLLNQPDIHLETLKSRTSIFCSDQKSRTGCQTQSHRDSGHWKTGATLQEKQQIQDEAPWVCSDLGRECRVQPSAHFPSGRRCLDEPILKRPPAGLNSPNDTLAMSENKWLQIKTRIFLFSVYETSLDCSRAHRGVTWTWERSIKRMSQLKSYKWGGVSTIKSGAQIENPVIEQRCDFHVSMNRLIIYICADIDDRFIIGTRAWNLQCGSTVPYGAAVCLKLGKIVIDQKVIDQHFEGMSHETIAVCDWGVSELLPCWDFSRRLHRERKLWASN